MKDDVLFLIINLFTVFKYISLLDRQLTFIMIIIIAIITSYLMAVYRVCSSCIQTCFDKENPLIKGN